MGFVDAGEGMELNGKEESKRVRIWLSYDSSSYYIIDR